MLDYKEIIKHYGGGMSGRALVEQGGWKQVRDQ